MNNRIETEGGGALEDTKTVESKENIIEREAAVFDEQIEELVDTIGDITWKKKMLSNHKRRYEEPMDSRKHTDTASIKVKEEQYSSFKKQFLQKANEKFPKKITAKDKILKGYSHESADLFGVNKKFDFLERLVSENIEHWREISRYKKLRKQFNKKEVKEIQTFLADFEEELILARRRKNDIDTYNKDGRIIREELDRLTNEGIKIYEEILREALIKDGKYSEQGLYSYPDGICKRINQKINQKIEEKTKVKEKEIIVLGTFGNRSVNPKTTEYAKAKKAREENFQNQRNVWAMLQQHGQSKATQKDKK